MKKARNILVFALMLATVASMGSVAGTYAKYTTTGDVTDTARVAKFGVKLTTVDTNVDGQGLFEKTYKNPAGDAVTVEASSKVIAPGTTGSVAATQITGTPEVKVKVKNVSDITLTGWEIPAPTETDANAKEFYCPLKFTIGTTTIEGATKTTAAELEKAIEDLINSDVDVEANGNLGTVNGLSWTWDFEGGNDTKDTALGDLANAPTISVSITTSVTQID